jgi:hypothetical protein
MLADPQRRYAHNGLPGKAGAANVRRPCHLDRTRCKNFIIRMVSTGLSIAEEDRITVPAEFHGLCSPIESR